MEHSSLIIALVIVVLGVLGIRLYYRFNLIRPQEKKVIQGNPPLSIVARSQDLIRHPDEKFLWGERFLNDEEASVSFLAVGSPGSGKTLNILFLLRTVVEQINTEGSNVRALIYDSKNDFYRKLRAIGLSDEQIVILNPFDKRRAAWDIAKDITDPKHAEELALILVPRPQGEKDPYFTNTARRLLAGIITALQISKKGEWTLRDLILIPRWTEQMEEVLLSCKYTQDLCSHLKNEKTFESVRSTLDSALDPLKTIAASWEGAERKITITEWFDSQKVFVMGNDPDGKEPIRRMNQLFFTFVAKRILARPDSAKAKHWIFLDELRELGKLDSLSDAMVTGRSKGASLVLGFQDLEGLIEEYGSNTAFEIIGCSQNIALLKVGPAATQQQEWQSKVAGSLRYSQKNIGLGIDAEGKTSRSISHETKTDPYFIPSYFARIPKVSEKDGMHGVFFRKDECHSVTFQGEFLWHEINGKGVSRNSIPLEDKTILNLIPVTFEDQLLEPWEKEDAVRLGILEKMEEKGLALEQVQEKYKTANV